MSRMHLAQRKASLRLFWALISVFVLVLATSSLVVASAATDHTEEYGKALSIKRNTVDVESDSYVQSPVLHGEVLQSTFTWVVPKDEPRPEPGDTMTVHLPEWLRPAEDHTDLKAGDYTTCSWSKGESDVVCAFTDKVKEEKDKDKELTGHFVLDMIALEGKGKDSLRWGDQDVDAFDLLVGTTSDQVQPPSPDTHLPLPPNENVRMGEITKSLNSFREVEYGGQSYVRLQWVVDVPAENFDLAQSLTLHDKLQEVKSDAWGGWSVPQYLAPDMEIEILRRDGGALEHGVWDASEAGCAAAAEQGIDCADLVATIRGHEVMERPGRIVESVAVDGGIPEAEWHEKLPTEFKIKMSPLVKGAAYRIVFYTFVPAENLPEHGAEEKAIAQNSLDLNGLTIKSDEHAEIFTQPKDGSGATGTMGMFRIENAVVGDAGKATGKEFRFDFNCDGVTGTLTADARETSKESPKFPHGTTCEVTQDVESIQMDGFKLDVGENPRTIVVEAGEVKALRFGTVYEAPPKSGTFAVRSVIADPKPSGMDRDREYTIRYECDKPSNDGSVQGQGQLQVRGDGTIVESPEFLAGTTCTILGSDEEAAAISGQTLVPHIDRSDIVVPVGSGAATPVATVQLTNTYVPEVSRFTLINNVDGVETLQQPMTYLYTCGAASGQLKAMPGETVESPELPVGTQCDVALDRTSADIPGYDLKTEDAAQHQTITIGAVNEPPVPVEFQQHYATHMGRFKVKNKVVSVGNKGRVPEVFDFTYTCTKAGENDIQGEIRGVTDGSTKESEPIPEGYRCSVSSNDPQSAGSTLVIDIGSPVVIAKGSVPEVEVTHAYARAKGELAITMKLDDPKASPVGGVYAFDYVCKPPENKPETGIIEGTMGAIGAGESATSETIPEGAVCTVQQQDTGSPQGDLANSGFNSVLVLERNGNPQMQAARKYDDWRGSLTINSEITGSGASASQVHDHKIQVGYVCYSNDVVVSEGTRMLTPGESMEVKDIHIGAECSVTQEPEMLETDSLRYEPDESTTEVTATKITGDEGRSEVNLRNVYTELGRIKVATKLDGPASNIISDDTSYTYEAQWTEQGESYAEEFSISRGDTYSDLPPLPVGTPVTIQEVLPENNPVVHWGVPSYKATPEEALFNHGDGTVTLTVQPKATVDNGVQLDVINSANPPAWWLSVPFAPLLVGKPVDIPTAETNTEQQSESVKPEIQPAAESSESWRHQLWISIAGGVVAVALLGIGWQQRSRWFAQTSAASKQDDDH